MAYRDQFLIETDELATHITDKNIRIIDVTVGPVKDTEGNELPAAADFIKMHIPGAIWLDQAVVLSDTGALYAYVLPVITYCGAGIAASINAFAAIRAGWKDVLVYDASLQE